MCVPFKKYSTEKDYDSWPKKTWYICRVVGDQFVIGVTKDRGAHPIGWHETYYGSFHNDNDDDYDYDVGNYDYDNIINPRTRERRGGEAVAAGA